MLDKTADVKADIQNIPFNDNYFELIICNHILEHVDSYSKALDELNRVLKPNGILILSFPLDRNYSTVFENNTVNDSNERIKLFGQMDHLRIFGQDSKKIIEKHCFRVNVIDGNKLPCNIRTVIGPANYDSNQIFVCYKNRISLLYKIFYLSLTFIYDRQKVF